MSNNIDDMDRQLHEQIEQVGTKIAASFSTTLSDEKNQVLNIQQQFSFLNINTVEYAVPVELQFVDYLGGGNYGNVIKVRTPDGIELAVKKMYEPFSHEVKARRVYRELKLLQLINHGNIIRFVNMYTPDRELRSFKNVYIVSVYAGVSLKQVLDRQKQLGIRMINFDHVKYLIYQLLRALKYLHSANVIHRDLKPSNLAITEECDLTVLDFGLARTVPNNADNLTAYVISRWYRSPEVIYWNNVSYNAKADVWSVGCILAELLTQMVLFPGSEAMEQYKLIIRLCGSPDEELMNKIEQQNSPAMRMVIERISGKCERRDFRRVFAQYPMDAVDLLDKLLVLDPDRRISVEEALQHAYMRDYHLPEDEPIAEQPFNIEDNDTTKTLNDWKEIVWQELQMHYQEVQHLQQQQNNFPLSALDYSNSSTSEQMVTQQSSQPEHLSSVATADFPASSAAISPLSSFACHSQQHTFAASASLITPVIPTATSVTTAINNNCTAFSAAPSSTSNSIINTMPAAFGPAALTVAVSNVSFSASPNSSQTTFVPISTATTSANIFPPATSSINANLIVVNGKEHAVAVSPTSAPTPSSLSPSTFRQCSSI